MGKQEGLFITVEGIEGSGKSSLVTALSQWLAESGRPFVVTREPGGTDLGKSIRELLLQPTDQIVSPTAELLLFSADRAQHVEKVLRPALSGGQIVLCDRYIDSTLAYQGSARGMPSETLKSVISLSTGGLIPDLTLLLDLDPEAGLSRARAREASGEAANSWSRFEGETLAFHRAVRDGFLALAAAEPARFLVLDASSEKTVIAAAARRAVEERLA